MKLACHPKKAYGRSKARPNRALSRSGKAHARVERAKVGPARTQARLEKAYSVARGFTLLGCFQAREFCSSSAQEGLLLITGVH